MTTYKLGTADGTLAEPRPSSSFRAPAAPHSVTQRWQHITRAIASKSNVSSVGDAYVVNSDVGYKLSVRIEPLVRRWVDVIRHYEIQDSVAVFAFLNARPGILNLLRGAEPLLRQIFGNSHLELKVAIDPEIEAAKSLVVYIYTSLPVEEALDRLDQFDSEWYKDDIDPSAGDLSFNLKFL